MPSRAQDWLKQAKRDLEHAKEDLKSGFYEWGCFSSQQAAEKAIKALYQHLHPLNILRAVLYETLAKLLITFLLNDPKLQRCGSG
jgi:HEPN domain-containing protein